MGRVGRAMGVLTGQDAAFVHEVALVTGASQGIGSAIVRALATRCRAIVIAYRTHRSRAEALAGELPGCASLVHQLDVRDAKDVAHLMAVIDQRYGRLDVLVNNAGITADRTVAKMSDREWREVLDVNLSGAFHCSRAAIPLMMRASRGRIINIGSMMGQIASHGQANYGASKAGLVGFSRALAVELAPVNITVNVVSPGYIATELTDRLIPEKKRAQIAAAIPIRRFGRPEEVAEVVSFLADGASYITGTVIHVTGGLAG